MSGSGKVPELILNNDPPFGTLPGGMLCADRGGRLSFRFCPMLVRPADWRCQNQSNWRSTDSRGRLSPHNLYLLCDYFLCDARFAFQFQFSQVKKQREAERDSDREHGDQHEPALSNAQTRTLDSGEGEQRYG
jgi:hypothetical protein